MASLGDLYDARSEKFLGYSLLKTNLPESCNIIADMPHTDFKYDYKNTFDLTRKVTYTFIEQVLKKGVDP